MKLTIVDNREEVVLTSSNSINVFGPFLPDVNDILNINGIDYAVEQKKFIIQEKSFNYYNKELILEVRDCKER